MFFQENFRFFRLFYKKWIIPVIPHLATTFYLGRLTFNLFFFTSDSILYLLLTFVNLQFICV